MAATGPGFAASYADYEAVRAHAVACFSPTSCPSSATLPLLGVAFLSPAGDSVSVVVANANMAVVNFTLTDGAAARSTACIIPAMSIQTYTFPVV